MKVWQLFRDLCGVGVCLLVSGFLITAGCDSAEPDLRVRDFRLPVLDGTGADSTFQLSSTQGKVVVLHFFAPWCDVCKAEAPALNAVHERFKDQAFVLVGVATQAESIDQIRAFREQYDVPYRIVIDDGRVALQGYNVRQFPTTYFIDKDVNLYGPYGALTEEEITDLVQSLLHENTLYALRKSSTKGDT